MKATRTYGDVRRKLDDAANAAATAAGCELDEVKVVGWVSEIDGVPDTFGISDVEHATLHDREDVIAIVFRGTVDWETMRWVEPEDEEVAS